MIQDGKMVKRGTQGTLGTAFPKKTHMFLQTLWLCQQTKMLVIHKLGISILSLQILHKIWNLHCVFLFYIDCTNLIQVLLLPISFTFIKHHCWFKSYSTNFFASVYLSIFIIFQLKMLVFIISLKTLLERSHCCMYIPLRHRGLTMKDI